MRKSPFIPAVYMIIALFTFQTAIGNTGKYHSYTELTQKLKQLEQKHSSIFNLRSIGKTGQNRDIWLAEITSRQTGKPETKPAMFLCANIEGDHLIGSETALKTIEYILNNAESDNAVKEMLNHYTCYILPRLNPDGAERFFADVLHESPSNFTPVDRDHDGLYDEDPPKDLNGDGMITLMRVKGGLAEYAYADEAGRLLKKADPEKGEKAVYRVYTEGIDHDGDGRFAEDGHGGVNPNRNFPHNYPYYQKDAGSHMVSEPETRAVIEFFHANPNIAIVMSYSKFDNLIHSPKPPRKTAGTDSEAGESPGFSRRPRRPETEINHADVPYFAKAGELYRETTGINSSSDTEKPMGAFHEWAYFQYGVFSLTTPVWNAPEIEEKNGQSTSDDKKWLAWIDADNIENAFVEWQHYKHPVLGDVEIGGFAPYIRTNPPAPFCAEQLENHARFFVSLADFFPKIVLANLTISQKDNNLFLVEAIVENTGYLPTHLAHGEISRAIRPTRARLEGSYTLLAGTKLVFLKTLHGSGGSEKLSWLVQAKPGTQLQLEITAEKAGRILETVILR